MNLQHETHISKLSTSQLVSSLQKTQYATLTSFVTNLNITGNDLISLQKLSEFEVNVKLGHGNPNLKLFKTFLSHVQTKPEDLFPLKPALKPKLSFRNSQSSVSQLQAVLASQRQATPSVQTIDSRPNQISKRPSFKEQINFTQTRLNPTNVTRFSQKLSELANIQDSGVQQKPQTEQKPQVTRQSFRTTPNLPVSKPAPVPEPAEMPKQYEKKSPFIKSKPSLPNPKQHPKQEQQQIIRKPVPTITKEELPEYINTLSQNHQEPLEDELPEYLNVTTPDYPPQEEEPELPEYINTDAQPSSNVVENPYPKPKHFLDPKERHKLESALTKAMKELQVTKMHQEEIYSNVAEDEESGEEAANFSPDSPDSFESVGSAEPLRRQQPPPLPERPPEIFQSLPFKKVKVRDSMEEGEPTSEQNVAVPSSQTSHTLHKEPPMKPSAPKQSNEGYSRLPTPILEPPSIPIDLLDPEPDNNEYEQPVTLTSPQYVIRRIKFFRDVTREQGAQMLMHKPIGTFLLRPSNTYLAVLMFRGKSRMNNMPVCCDAQTDQYYLSPPPGTLSAMKFNNMLELLNYYSRHSPSSVGDKLLNLEINDI